MYLKKGKSIYNMNKFMTIEEANINGKVSVRLIDMHNETLDRIYVSLKVIENALKTGKKFVDLDEMENSNDKN